MRRLRFLRGPLACLEVHRNANGAAGEVKPARSSHATDRRPDVPAAEGMIVAGPSRRGINRQHSIRPKGPIVRTLTGSDLVAMNKSERNKAAQNRDGKLDRRRLCDSAS